MKYPLTHFLIMLRAVA